MPVHRPPTRRRPGALLAGALAALLLAAGAPLPAAATAGDDGDPAGREWLDSDNVELTEGQANGRITALHCRRDARENRVALQKWSIESWGYRDVEVRDLGASTCETVVWDLGRVTADLAGSYRLVTRIGSEQVSYVGFGVFVQLRAPSIVTHPSGRTVAPGQSATFHSTAGSSFGDPAPTTRWFSSRDGVTWHRILDATAFTYQTPEATAGMDGMRYRAEHRRSSPDGYVRDGVAVSDVPTLTVRQAPTVTREPDDVEVPLGGTAVFEAAAGGVPVPAVQWEAAPPGADWAPVPGATSGRLEVPDVPADADGTRYRAASSSVAGPVVRTREATLTVSAPPVVGEQPRGVAALPGEPVTFG